MMAARMPAYSFKLNRWSSVYSSDFRLDEEAKVVLSRLSILPSDRLMEAADVTMFSFWMVLFGVSGGFPLILTLSTSFTDDLSVLPIILLYVSDPSMSSTKARKCGFNNFWLITSWSMENMQLLAVLFLTPFR